MHKSVNNLDSVAMTMCMPLVQLKFIHASPSFVGACICACKCPGMHVYPSLDKTGGEGSSARTLVLQKSCSSGMTATYACGTCPFCLYRLNSVYITP